MLVIPAPSYSLARAAWIPRLTIRLDDDTTERRERKPCESWSAAMAASRRLVSRAGRAAASVPRPTYPCPRCGAAAPLMRLSHVDLRRAGYEQFPR